MPDKEQMQDAVLTTIGGRDEHVKLPAFPGNPDLVRAFLEGAVTRYFVPNGVIVGFGTNPLSYQEVEVYELGGSDA